jgi:hypothetical protein
MAKHRQNGDGNDGSVVVQGDPLAKRLDAIERMLRQFMAMQSTDAKLTALVQQQWDTVYADKFRELDDLRTECVRLLAVLRTKAEQSAPVSQEELNGHQVR